VFDGDELRGELLAELAARHGRQVVPSPVPFADVLAHQHDRLADWLAGSVDVGALRDLADAATAPGAGPGW
jgi:hypothetical protein